MGPFLHACKGIAQLQVHSDFYEKKARAAMRRHGADRAQVEFPAHMPGRFEVAVYCGSDRIAVTLSERCPPLPTPAENARRYTDDDGTR